MRKLQLHVVVPCALLVATLVVSCGTSNGAEPNLVPRAPVPTPTTYVVTGVTEAGQARPLVPGSEIRFAFKDGQLGITAGCNSMSGAYRIEGSRLTVESLSTTEMGCEQRLMAQDTWVAGLFAGPVQFSAGNDAAIISGDVVLALTDREVAPPDKPLEGTRWVLESLVDGEAASSVPSGSKGSLRINGGSLTYDAGCTGGSGSVKVDGDALTFTDVDSRATPCREGDVVYETFAAVLRGSATYAITENSLTITNGHHGLTFRAR